METFEVILTYFAIFQKPISLFSKIQFLSGGDALYDDLPTCSHGNTDRVQLFCYFKWCRVLMFLKLCMLVENRQFKTNILKLDHIISQKSTDNWRLATINLQKSNSPVPTRKNQDDNLKLPSIFFSQRSTQPYQLAKS